MIGEPTNFVHTTHVGSGDMGLGLASVGFILSSLQNILPTEYRKPANAYALMFVRWTLFRPR